MLSQVERLQQCAHIVRIMHNHGLRLPEPMLADLDRLCANIEVTWDKEPICWLRGAHKTEPKREW